MTDTLVENFLDYNDLRITLLEIWPDETIGAVAFTKYWIFCYWSELGDWLSLWEPAWPGRPSQKPEQENHRRLNNTAQSPEAGGRVGQEPTPRWLGREDEAWSQSLSVLWRWEAAARGTSTVHLSQKLESDQIWDQSRHNKPETLALFK